MKTATEVMLSQVAGGLPPLKHENWREAQLLRMAEHLRVLLGDWAQGYLVDALLYEIRGR